MVGQAGDGRAAITEPDLQLKKTLRDPSSTLLNMRDLWLMFIHDESFQNQWLVKIVLCWCNQAICWSHF